MMKQRLNASYKFIIETTSGMVYGLFATLIIGVILKQFGLLLDFDFTLFNNTLNIGSALQQVATVVQSFVGIGIGVGVGLVLKKEALKLISLAVSGGIATSTLLFTKADPLVAYLVVIFTVLLLDVIFKKKTPFDIILIPLFTIIVSYSLTLLLFTPITTFATLVGMFVNDVAAVK